MGKLEIYLMGHFIAAILLLEVEFSFFLKDLC